MRLVVVAVGLLVASISGSWATERDAETPQQWFARMVQSLHTLNYEGIFVYVSGPRMETLKLRHVVDEQGEREHLISLTGAPREVLRSGAAVTSVLPDARSVFSRSSTQPASFPVALGEAFPQLKQLYSFKLEGRDRIAERAVQQIHVAPRDEYRYGYRIWLDRHTAIPLRVDLLDEAGYPLEQVMFTAFRLMEDGKAIADHDLPRSDEGSASAMPVDKSNSAMVPAPWQVRSLPEGFTLYSHIKEAMPGSNQPVDHVVFSDGLASVSAYMEHMPNRKGLSGLSRMGAFSAFGLQLEDYQVTVVGEVPPKTVEYIGRAIALGSEE